MRISHILKYRVAVLSCLGALLLSTSALAHCDSMDGPVIRDAQAALEKRDPTPVLKWVTKDREGEVREAFQRALAVRAKGDDARQLADHYFFETLVRTHRAGEGEAYTGLKPSGNIDPGAAAADRALELGASQELAKEISEAVKDGIAKRFATALELRKHAGGQR